MEQYKNELLEKTRMAEYNKRKFTTTNIIEDLNNLMGAEVYVFGQKTKMNKEIPEFCVDTRDILKELEDTDFDLMDLVKDYNITLDREFWDKLDNIDINYELIEKLVDEEILVETGADNTYNWCSPIYHDINFVQYKDKDDNYYVALSVHRYGDTRGNYTDTVVYKFSYDSEFLEFLMDCGIKFNDFNYNGIDFECDTCVLNEGTECKNKFGEDLFNVYCSDREGVQVEIDEKCNEQKEKLKIGSKVELYALSNVELFDRLEQENKLYYRNEYTVCDINKDCFYVNDNSNNEKFCIKFTDIYIVKNED